MIVTAAFLLVEAYESAHNEEYSTTDHASTLLFVLVGFMTFDFITAMVVAG